MTPNPTKPVVIITHDVDGETIVVLGGPGGGNRIRMATCQELTIESRLFGECSECGGYCGGEPVLTCYIQECLGIRTEPRIKPEE